MIRPFPPSGRYLCVISPANPILLSADRNSWKSFASKQTRDFCRGQKMEFAQAVAAHTAWKRKFTKYLGKPDGSIEPLDVSLDKGCPLGQWIYGPGAKYSYLPEYSVLRSEHARFHRAAADVVLLANSGQSVGERITIGSQSEFTMASSAIVLAIMAMKKSVAK